MPAIYYRKTAPSPTPRADGSSSYPADSCKALSARGSGWYYIRRVGYTYRLYCDITSTGGAWMRLSHASGSTVRSASSAKIAPAFLKSLGIKRVGWSDSSSTMVKHQSWYFEDPTMSAVGHHESKPSPYYYPSYPVDKWTAFANVANGMVPVLGKRTSNWKDYTGGYIYFNGVIKSYGSWKKMYQGCGWTVRHDIGSKQTFRIGGQRSHTGEYIHTSCNGYRYNFDNSITSRPGHSHSTLRSMWVSSD
jgi:hypothetical protein